LGRVARQDQAGIKGNGRTPWPYQRSRRHSLFPVVKSADGEKGQTVGAPACPEPPAGRSPQAGGIGGVPAVLHSLRSRRETGDAGGEGEEADKGRESHAWGRIPPNRAGFVRLRAKCKHLLLKELAEREGFEPSVTLPPHRFSRPAQSAALAPLRDRRGAAGS